MLLKMAKIPNIGILKIIWNSQKLREMGVGKDSFINKINLYLSYHQVNKYYLKLTGHFHFCEMTRISKSIETQNRIRIAWV